MSRKFRRTGRRMDHVFMRVVQLAMVILFFVACGYTVATYAPTKAALVAAEEERDAAEAAVKGMIVAKYEPGRSVGDIKVYHTWQRGYTYKVGAFGRHHDVNDDKEVVWGISHYINTISAVNKVDSKHGEGFACICAVLLTSCLLWVAFKIFP